ncbi:MAG: BREX-1 system phosphatase PglZ type A [Bacteroidia bacterium]
MTDKIHSALEQLFEQHRLVFWYDEKVEMKALFNDLQLNNVSKITIENNEFGIKYKVLQEEPDQKFLIYQSSAKPNDHENWLLDLNLANYEFYTEPSSLYLQDLGLSQEFKPLVQEHIDFFNSEKRLKDLKTIIEPDDTERKIRLKILSILVGTEVDWEKVLYALFAELAKNKSDKWNAIEKFGLTDFFWKTVERKYAYKDAKPTIKDFLIKLFQDNFHRSLTNGKGILSKDAYLFVNRWKENAKAQSVFSELSQTLSIDLNIEQEVNSHSPEELLDDDTFDVIDKKILQGILQHLMQETLSQQTLKEWIQKREQKFFYKNYQNIYSALSSASALLDEIRKINLKFASPKEGIDLYAKQFYQIDLLYRKYIFFTTKAEHQNLLKGLTEKVEKAYSNSFLQTLGDNWQKQLEGLSSWDINGIKNQRDFFKTEIKPYSDKGNKIYVIISDAFRYETAMEFRDMILKEDRYTADLSFVLGSLPSYTQLGMASLLPHQKLSVQKGSDIIIADGVSTQGTANRTKILEKHCKGIAIQAEDFLKMHTKTDGREFAKTYDVVYIYSNCIDKTGDDKTSEHKVFQATDEEFQNITRIIKQIANMNASNIIITSDHGYLYQHNALDESDFSEFKAQGNIYRSTRRFIIGENLKQDQMLMHFKGSALHLNEEMDALIPKSVTRLRVSGAGSRFVHGGASLQEIVVPVLAVNKGRRTDTEKVEVDVLGSNRNVASNLTGVTFYQMQATGEKVLPRLLKIGFYSENGKPVSDIHNLNFNVSDSDSLARERKQSFVFTSDATNYNGQDVKLRMEEAIDGSNQFRVYKEFTYRMNISFGSEFDDF